MKLFKYRSLAQEDGAAFLRDLVTKGEAWFSSPLRFNDPFEFRFQPDLDATVEQRERLFLKVYRDRNPHQPEAEIRARARAWATRKLAVEGLDLERAVSDAVAEKFGKEISVFSLCADPLVILMWSHYADEHKGVCLEYETEDMTDTPYPVSYSGALPSVPAFGATPDDMRAITLTKADHWSYEREWRCLAHAEGVRQFPQRALVGVILGARIEAESEVLVRSWVSRLQHNVEIRKAGLSRSGYALVID